MFLQYSAFLIKRPDLDTQTAFFKLEKYDGVIMEMSTGSRSLSTFSI